MRLLTPVLLLALAACSREAVVHSDFDPGADFSAYRSYRFAEPDITGDDSSVARDPRVLDAVTSTIRADFSRRPLAETDDADLVISITLVASEGRAVDQWGYQWDAAGGGPAGEAYRIEEGTLVLNFFDADTEQLVWRSWAHGAVTRTGDPELELLEELVREMLMQYPPRPGAN